MILYKTSNMNYSIIIFLYIVNLIIQNYNLGKIANVFTDEGVYLYSAKLLNEGFIPYKDFFLAQPPFLLYLAGLVLHIVSYNMNIFHFLYTLFAFSSIFPIFFVVLQFTRSRLSAVLSVVFFSTYSELVQWDMSSFAFRQASLPFLAFSLFFIFVKPKIRLSGLLLGIFSIILISNLLVTLCLIIAILLSELLVNKTTIQQTFKKYYPLILTFGLITLFGYLIILLIPNAYSNLLNYQLDRLAIPYLTRLEWIKFYTLPNNWPILFFGLAGSLLISKKVGLFGIFNILSTIVIVLAGKSYYPHYLTILAVGFCISCGVLVKKLNRNFILGILTTFIMLISIFYASFVHLRDYLIYRRTPEFFSLIEVLKSTPEPLFSFEPIYGLYADKDLTFHYRVADMRYFRVMGTNMDAADYIKILKNSQTVLVEPFASAFLGPESLYYINQNFRQVYDDGLNKIYVKNNSN